MASSLSNSFGAVLLVFRGKGYILVHLRTLYVKSFDYCFTSTEDAEDVGKDKSYGNKVKE